MSEHPSSSLRRRLENSWLMLLVVSVALTVLFFGATYAHNYLLLGERSREADSAWSFFYGTTIVTIVLPLLILSPSLLSRGLRKNREHRERGGRGRVQWELTAVLAIAVVLFSLSLSTEAFARARELTCGDERTCGN